MKYKVSNKVFGGILGISLVLGGMSACSDDHFDLNDGGTATAGNTIWQNIQDVPELSTLAQILQRVKVYTADEEGNIKKNEKDQPQLTYADFLNGNQTLSLWAPINGDYYQPYLDSLAKVDELRAEGQAYAAAQLEFKVGKQLVQNHLARFNFESTADATPTVRLYNGKLAVYDRSNYLFNDVALNPEVGRIPSSNGMLYGLSGISPFAYNVYDYIVNHDDYSSINSIYKEIEKKNETFDASSSTAWKVNSSGQMVYIDSVWSKPNEMISSSGADIDNEDSLYVAVIPNNNAWTEAYAKVKALYDIKDRYQYNYSRETNFSNTATLSDVEIDSLINYNVQKKLLTNMFFSPSVFPNFDLDNANTENIVAYVRAADSLKNTNGLYIYKPQGATVHPYFSGQYVQASNGIIFPLDSYELDPAYSFVTRNNINMYNSGNLGSSTNTTAVYYSPISDEKINDSISIEDIPDKSFGYFSMTTSNTTASQMNLYIPLPNLFSTKYKISIQTVPNRLHTDHQWIQTVTEKIKVQVVDEETGEITEETRDTTYTREFKEQKSTFYARLYDDEGNVIKDGKLNGEVVNSRTGQSENITVSDTDVMTYTIWDEITIPKCYADLPSNFTRTFPVLNITMRRRDQDTKPGTKTLSGQIGLSIVKIIVQPVRE